MRATRAEVYEALDSERDYQDGRWGSDRQHSLEEWLVYMEAYQRRAKDILTDGLAPYEAVAIMRKVTALGVAALEQHGAPKR